MKAGFATFPTMSLGIDGARESIPAMIVSVSTVPVRLSRAPTILAELSLMVQAVSVVGPLSYTPPPCFVAELPLMVRLVESHRPDGTPRLHRLWRNCR